MGETETGQVSNRSVVADDHPNVGRPIDAEERQEIDAKQHAITRVGDTGEGDFDAAQVVDSRAAAEDVEGETSSQQTAGEQQD